MTGRRARVTQVSAAQDGTRAVVRVGEDGVGSPPEVRAPVEVREVGPGERVRAGEVVAAAYLAQGLVSPQDEYTAMLRDVDQRLAHATVLVALIEGEVVGSITLTVADTPESEIAEPGELEARMLGVHPASSRRGVASALIEGSVRLARERGLRLVLSTLPAMRAAQRLYAAIGLERAPDRDWVADWDAQAVADGTAPTLLVYLGPPPGA